MTENNEKNKDQKKEELVDKNKEATEVKEPEKEVKAKAYKKKKERKNIPFGIAHVKATFNNTIVTITDLTGNTLVWASSGNQGFKGSRKSTHFAAQQAALNAGKKALDMGMRSINVEVKGPGAGREAAIRALQSSGLRISIIKDVTPIPHNGCRQAKKRRV